MLQNADQSRNEDYRAQNFEEEEGQAFIVHAAEHEVCPFVGKPEEFFKHLGKSFHKTQTNIGVEEEPGQQDFNDKQLNNITNTDLLAVMADQQASIATTTIARTKCKTRSIVAPNMRQVKFPCTFYATALKKTRSIAHYCKEL